MDFRFTEEQEAFRQDIRDFLREEPPDKFPIQDPDEGYGNGAWSREYMRRLGEKGWIGLMWPEEFGGKARTPTYLYLLFTELAYAYAPAEALFYIEQGGGTINRYGQEELKREVMPRLAAGEATVVEGLSEMNAGSDLLSLETRALEDGEDYILNGEKIWTSNGHLADYDLVIAKTDPEQPRHRGISCFLVDLSLPGVSVSPILDICGNKPFSEIFFDDVRLPKRYLVGEKNRGFVELLETLEWDRFWGRCMKASYLKRMLEDLVTYCKGNPSKAKALAGDPWVQNMLAEFDVEVEACRVLFLRALWAMENGTLSMEASIGKTFADEAGQRFSRGAMQILGLRGQLGGDSKWAPLQGRIEGLYLSSFGHTLAGGSSEIQRMTIATRGLGLPR